MARTRAARRWYVVQTNIKCEERAARSLRSSGFRVYLPKMKKTIIHHRTKKPIDRYFKLFNRYLFVSVEPENTNWFSLRRCDGVETVLGIDIDGRPCEISREVVRRFMLAQRKGQFNVLSPHSRKLASQKRFPLGSRISLREDHPFGGFYGNVIDVKGRGIIKATMEVFGRLVPVEIKPEDVEHVYVDNPKAAA